MSGKRLSAAGERHNINACSYCAVVGATLVVAHAPARPRARGLAVRSQNHGVDRANCRSLSLSVPGFC